MTITTIPPSLLIDASQLVKANSIIGNKKDNLTILYTPASNLHKDGSMDTGSVSFKNDKLVRRTHVIERVNSVVNRLVKTKVVREVDHENEKVERIKEEGRVRRLAANVRVSHFLHWPHVYRLVEDGVAGLNPTLNGNETDEGRIK
jgi:hypothetical protein